MSGDRETIVDSNGKQYVDLASGFGSAILGHNCETVTTAVSRAACGIWNVGKEKHPLLFDAERAVHRGLDAPYKVAAFHSTGGEANEFAMRIAAQLTGRAKLVGFKGSMHGKSAAAASLSWPTALKHLSCISLPFVPQKSEAVILDNLEATLSEKETAAVFIEPIQGSNGGFEASIAFYRSVIEMCAAFGALSVFDEVLTGWYRCGAASYALSQGLRPDVLVFGKCMSNGFPASAVLVGTDLEITASMLPNSTFSNNPLACAAIVATLKEMERLDIKSECLRVGSMLTKHLSTLDESRVYGRGLMRFIQYESAQQATLAHSLLLEAGIYTSCVNRTIRVMPAATINRQVLDQSLGTLLRITDRVRY